MLNGHRRQRTLGPELKVGFESRESLVTFASLLFE